MFCCFYCFGAQWLSNSSTQRASFSQVFLLLSSDRLFLFDTTNGNQASNNGAAYSFNFNRNFTNVPRVGLGIVNMDFQYSPVFSCQVSSNTTESSATLLITTQTTSTTNQLYIMYLATDHDFFGVFMPGPLSTLTFT